MEGTGGLVSAYQFFDFSAQRVLQHNLGTTAAQEPEVEIAPLPEVLKLREMEFIKIKVPPEHVQLAFALLMRRVPLQVLQGAIFGIRRSDLRILREAGIPYEEREEVV